MAKIFLNQLNLPSITMTLTTLSPQNIEFIINLIDERIQRALSSSEPEKPETQKKNYHTTYEIRDLIRIYWQEFKDWIIGDSFHSSMLVDFIKSKIELRPGDVEIIKDATKQNQNRYTRIEKQIYNAARKWKNAPFVKSDKQGHYKIIR
jgi:hypothetical protein